MGIKYPVLARFLGVDESSVVDHVNNLQGPANTQAGTLGATYKPLISEELVKFCRSFERQFVIPFAQRETPSADGVDGSPLMAMHVRHIGDALMGAGVMKYQTNSNFGGEIPVSGEFCMQPNRAAWFGIGNDWDAFPALTAAAFNNWIHAGTTLMGGTAGNDVKIGPKAVHVIFGFAEQFPAPVKTESIEVRYGGTIQPGYVVGFQQKLPGGGNLQVKELDDVYLLRDTSRFRTRIWTNDGGTSIPYTLGYSYLPYDILQNFINPANLPGTTQNVILTT